MTIDGDIDVWSAASLIDLPVVCMPLFMPSDSAWIGKATSISHAKHARNLSKGERITGRDDRFTMAA